MIRGFSLDKRKTDIATVEITYKTREWDTKERIKRDWLSRERKKKVKLARATRHKTWNRYMGTGLDVTGLWFKSKYLLKKVTKYHCRTDNSKVKDARIHFT